MIFDHARRLSGRRSAAFGDHEDDVPIILMLAHDLIARFANEIGNVDARQRIGAAHLQLFPDSNALEGLARLQGGQWAFEAREVKQCYGHGGSMAKEF